MKNDFLAQRDFKAFDLEFWGNYFNQSITHFLKKKFLSPQNL